MHLVQILLPVADNEGRRFERAPFDTVRAELTAQFGGVTAFVRSPAQGLWRDEVSGETSGDEMVLFEVMCEELDTAWWGEYRALLERRFRQQAIVTRAIAFTAL